MNCRECIYWWLIINGSVIVDDVYFTSLYIDIYYIQKKLLFSTIKKKLSNFLFEQNVPFWLKINFLSMII